jgi:RND superfamily putative drug exporter
MSRFLSTRYLARLSAHNPWKVITAWIAVIAIAVAFGLPNLGGVLSSEVRLANNPESVQGVNAIDDAGLSDLAPTSETVVIRSNDGRTVDDPAFQALTQQVTAELRALRFTWDPQSAEQIPFGNYYELSAAGDPAASALVSADRTTTIVNVPFPEQMLDHVEIGEFMHLVEEFDSDDFTVATAGTLSVNEAFTHAAEEDIVTGEASGIPAALIILAIVFGAIVAPLLPMAIGIAAIADSLAAVALIGQFAPQQTFVTNIVTVLGLAVGIDYALFIVDRYREFRATGSDRRKAIELAGATSSKAVVFSAGTVIFALAGLWIIPNNIFRSLGLGASLVVAATVLVSLTLLPAMLSLIGDRINWPRRRPMAALDTSHAHETDAYNGFWGRLTRTVMARPVVSVLLAGGILLAAAMPFFQMNTGFSSGADSLPPSNTRDAVEILEADFSAGMITPVRVVFEGERAEVEPVIDSLIAEIDQTPEWSTVSQPVIWSEEGTTSVLILTLAIPANSDAAFDAIDTLRNELIPATVGDASGIETYVSGDTPQNRDMVDAFSTYTPWVFAFVLGLSLILLTMAFRSIVIPIKAILLNLLSVGAAYGLMVLVFQEGFLIDLFGFQRSPVIESWIPLLLFSILFGLSMDYHVFLLSRIREHFGLTGQNRESVAIGLRSTARIITGAALIMVAVFAGLAAGQVVSFQQMGFGLGIAVLIDATLIRSVLVPASMTLLGKWNWYLPSWLAWLPDLRIEGGADAHIPGPEQAWPA